MSASKMSVGVPHNDAAFGSVNERIHAGRGHREYQRATEVSDIRSVRAVQGGREASGLRYGLGSSHGDKQTNTATG